MLASAKERSSRGSACTHRYAKLVSRVQPYPLSIETAAQLSSCKLFSLLFSSYSNTNTFASMMMMNAADTIAGDIVDAIDVAAVVVASAAAAAAVTAAAVVPTPLIVAVSVVGAVTLHRLKSWGANPLPSKT